MKILGVVRNKKFWYVSIYFVCLALVIYGIRIIYSYATSRVADPGLNLNPIIVIYILLSGFIFATLAIASWRIFFILGAILAASSALLFGFIYLAGQDSGIDGAWGLLGFIYVFFVLVFFTVHFVAFVGPAKLFLTIPHAGARVLAFSSPFIFLAALAWSYQGVLSASPLDCEKIISLDKKDELALFDARSSLGRCIYRRMDNHDTTVCSKFHSQHAQYACRAYFFIQAGKHRDCFASVPLWQSDPCFLSLALKMNDRNACNSIFDSYHHRQCLQRFPTN